MKKTLSAGEFQVLLALWKCGSGATIDEVVAFSANTGIIEIAERIERALYWRGSIFTAPWHHRTAR